MRISPEKWAELGCPGRPGRRICAFPARWQISTSKQKGQKGLEQQEKKGCKGESPPTIKSLLNNATENKVRQKGFLHKPTQDTHTNAGQQKHTHTLLQRRTWVGAKLSAPKSRQRNFLGRSCRCACVRACCSASVARWKETYMWMFPWILNCNYVL